MVIRSKYLVLPSECLQSYVTLKLDDDAFVREKINDFSGFKDGE